MSTYLVTISPIPAISRTHCIEAEDAASAITRALLIRPSCTVFDVKEVWILRNGQYAKLADLSEVLLGVANRLSTG